MEPRMTDQASKVMELANEEALRRNHEYIGTEHLLLGLIAERNGVAAGVLKNLKIDLFRVRREVDKIIVPGPESPFSRRLPMTPRAAKILEHAAEEAGALLQEQVGTEHLLLGILCEQEGVAAQVLMNLGLRLSDVRREVLAALGVVADPSSESCGETSHLPEPAKHIVAEFDRQIDVLQQRKQEASAAHDIPAAVAHVDLCKTLTTFRNEFLRRWPKD